MLKGKMSLEGKTAINRRQFQYPKLWTPNFIFICLVSLCNAMAFQGLNVSLPVYIDKLGGSPSLAGLAMGTLTAAAVIIRPFVGWALDRYGRKFIFLMGLLLFLLPSVVYVFMVPFSILLMMRFIQGFGWGISHTTAGTVASDIVPPLRMGEGMGTFNVTGSISSALAPLMILWIINQFSFSSAFVVISLLSVTSIIFSQALRYPKFAPPTSKSKMELFSRDGLQPALVILLIGTAQGTIFSFVALFARGRGISNPGLFFALMGITAIFSRPLTGKLLDRLGQRGFDLTVIISVPLMTLTLWIVSLTDASWYLAVGGALYGIGYGMIQSSMMVMLINMLPGKRGLANAMYGTCLDTGVAFGAILWGVVANLVGYQAMFRWATIPILLCLFVYFFRKPVCQMKI